MRRLLLLCLPLFACATTKSVPVPPSADSGALHQVKRVNWKGIKLEHARHYVWLTSHDEVLREMKTFLETF
jgi:hypothetical protein